MSFGVILFIHSNNNCGVLRILLCIDTIRINNPFNYKLIMHRKVIQIFKFQKQNRDISSDSLKKLVKSSGDECVAGYVRFKKIKPCAGYKKACRMAWAHLSKIKGGRPMENNLYAAVVRFRIIVFLIPLLLMFMAGMIFIIKQTKVKAIEIPTDIQEGIIIPKEVVTEADWQNSSYAGLYISVPGYSDCTWDSLEHSLLVYNPDGNECVMTYQVYVGGEQAAQSGLLFAGETEILDFYGKLTSGIYDMEIISKSYSTDLETEFNSMYQKVQLAVY